MDAILAAMTDSQLSGEHQRVVKQMLGSDFDQDIFSSILENAAALEKRSEDYFRNREAIIGVLEKRVHKSIATLEGKHKEALVVVNAVVGTTLGSDRFSDKNGFQSFGYDLWFSKHVANTLLPASEQSLDRQRYITARVMSTVATLMVLTDGSQRLVLRYPVE